MMKTNFKAIEFMDDNFIFIDQTKLPLSEEYIATDDYERIAEAIECLEVRGAPQIGVAVAYALALSVKNFNKDIPERFERAYKRLRITRPTAVNLFWALGIMKESFENYSGSDYYNHLLAEAKVIHSDDYARCEKIASNGLEIFAKKSTVLTHCNTGQLATGGEGTAFNVIKKGYENGLVEFVYADETRPLFQGSRLTAFELEKSGIPFAINTDSTAAVLMSQGKIDIVIVGSDRIAVNGDVANKIGTYSLAVLCDFHKIPFYVATPTSTIDRLCPDGSKIKIELRDKKEVLMYNCVEITRSYYDVYSPAFDVTPAKLITGIITEKALHKAPYNLTDV
ncbi:MAG: S-methyl-5-thioribose-1-phosphate isomerase [Ignavibacteria bacterium]